MRKRKEEKTFDVRNFAEFVDFICDDCKIKKPSRYDTKQIDTPFTEIDYRATNIISHIRFKNDDELTSLLRVYSDGAVFVKLAKGQGENGIEEINFEGHPEMADSQNKWLDIDTITIL